MTYSSICCCIRAGEVERDDLENPMLIEPGLSATECTLLHKAREQARRLDAIEKSMRDSDKQFKNMQKRALKSFKTVRRH